MKYKALAFLWIVFVFCCCAIASNSDTSDKPKDYWMGVYYDKSKIGSLHVTVRKGIVNDKDGWIRDESLRIRYRTGDERCTLNVERELCADSNYNPVSDSSKANGDSFQPMSFDETFSPGNVDYRTVLSGTKEERTAPILEGDQVALSSGSKYDFGVMTLSPGDSFYVSHLLTILKSLPTSDCRLCSYATTVFVRRREKITVGGKVYDTLFVSENSETGEDVDIDIKRWQLENGEVIKEERPVEHLLFLMETEENATEVDKGPGPLLAESKPEPPVKLTLHLAKTSPVNADYWMGVYWGTQKIGYFHVVITPDKLDGKKVFRKNESLHLRDPFGTSMRTDARFTAYADQDYFPILENSQASHGTGPVALEARYRGKVVNINTTIDGKSTQTTVPVTEDDRHELLDGCVYNFGVRMPKTGQSIDVQYGHMTADKTGKRIGFGNDSSVLSAIGRENLRLGGKTYDTLLISDTSANNAKITRWQLSNGMIIKQKMSILTMLLESKEEATKPIKAVKPKSAGKK